MTPVSPSPELQHLSVDHSWIPDTRRLRGGFRAYIAACLIALVCSFLPSNPAVDWVGMVSRGASFLLLLACLVFGYRAQSRLHRAGVARIGPWVIIAGLMIVSFLFGNFGDTNGEWLMLWLLGAIVPVWVLREAHRVSKGGSLKE